MIEVKNLVKKYGDHLAVDDLSFSIDQGKIYGFLGPNGAGKSTTMNIMTGYLGATSGEVVIDGHSILDEPEEAKRYIGYLPEMPPLYLDMKVLEYLNFVAGLKKVKKSERDEQIGQILQMIQLEDVSHRLIKNLSKGYRQRVGLAQAVIGFPEVIILDEPTVGLDPKQIIEIRELIRQLSKNHTILLSSHILAEIREVCNYIMIISHGKLVASDTPDNLESQFSGNKNTIEFTAKADLDETKRILKDIPFIADSDLSMQDTETTHARIRLSRDIDVREKLFFAFAENHRALLELTQSKVTLEKVFLELTQSDRAITEENAGSEPDESAAADEPQQPEETAAADGPQNPEEAAAANDPQQPEEAAAADALQNPEESSAAGELQQPEETAGSDTSRDNEEAQRKKEGES